MVTDAELRELRALEKACYPPAEAWDMATLRMMTSLNGAGLLRWYESPHRADGDGGGGGAGGVPNAAGENRQRGEQLAAFHLFDCMTAQLLTLDVHPAWRRCGLGTKLVRESMAKLSEVGHHRCTCEISERNSPSLRLHEMLGFTRHSLIPSYYGPGHNAWLLEARLGG